jgi:hypothetical protein
MGCENIQRLLHLNRPGELTARERQELESHLRSCPACAEEWQRIQQYEQQMSAARETPPVPADPQELTARVMSTIEEYPRRRPRFSLGTVVETWVRFLESATIRRTYAAVCLGLVVLFVIQHTLIARQVIDLERRMASGSPASTRSGLSYSIALDRIPQMGVTQPGEIRHLAGLAGVRLKENRLLLPRSVLRQWRQKPRAALIARQRLAARIPMEPHRLQGILRAAHTRKNIFIKFDFRQGNYWRKRP